MVVGVERGQDVEDGKATVVRPASIARHNLSPPSPIRPTNDVLVAPCLATTSVGRLLFFQHLLLLKKLSSSNPRVLPAAPPILLHSCLERISSETTLALEQEHICAHTYITIIPLSLSSSSPPTLYKVAFRATHHVAASDSAFYSVLHRLCLAVAKHSLDAHYPSDSLGSVRWC